MYTANTMASASEALGMTLPGSSSFPAESPEKRKECTTVGSAMLNLLEKNILPRDIMTDLHLKMLWCVATSVSTLSRPSDPIWVFRAGLDHDPRRLH